MVGIVSPHVYARELAARGGSSQLLREIRAIDRACTSFGVQPIYTLTHLCVVARVPYEDARDAIFDPLANYKTRKIAKRSGRGYRTIHEPSPQLKSLQRAILHNCLPRGRSTSVSYAFETGSSPLHAAREHIGARAMIHVDIRNFYDSIPAQRVFSVFSELGYARLFALELAFLSTVGHQVVLRSPGTEGLVYEILKEGYLPQGASTSGKIANLVCASLDLELLEIANKWGGAVTRYADDIHLSTPYPLSREEGSSIYSEIHTALRGAGYQTNVGKTRMLLNAESFKMLGLCVGSESVWLNSRYKKSLRAHLYGVEKFGVASHAISRRFDSELEFAAFAWGHFAYCASVEPAFAREVKERLQGAGIPRF